MRDARCIYVSATCSAYAHHIKLTCASACPVALLFFSKSAISLLVSISSGTLTPTSANDEARLRDLIAVSCNAIGSALGIPERYVMLGVHLAIFWPMAAWMGTLNCCLGMSSLSLRVRALPVEWASSRSK